MDEFIKTFFWTCIISYSVCFGLTISGTAATGGISHLLTAHLSPTVMFLNPLLSLAIAGWITAKRQGDRLQEYQKPIRSFESDADISESSPTMTQGSIDINKANESEISKLPTIGPILAKRIVSERRESSFKSLEDLQARCALKPHQIEQISPLIVFESPQKPGFINKLFKRSPDQLTSDKDKEEKVLEKPGKRIID